MTQDLAQSDFILNSDGSIYHLNLLPEEIANTIILVGDPERVPVVSQYFDQINLKKQKREFVAHTGRIGKLPISVISTGIGAGSIDIVLNELDALVNIDFKSRQFKSELTQLRLIRLGTCGGLAPEIGVDNLVVSEFGASFDGIIRYYQRNLSDAERELTEIMQQHFFAAIEVSNAYVAAGSEELIQHFSTEARRGITLTCAGFYGPQGRKLRAPLAGKNILDIAQTFSHERHALLNFEMETAAIYGLGRVLNHSCCSISTVLANRALKTFSKDPERSVKKMIEIIFAKLETL